MKLIFLLFLFSCSSFLPRPGFDSSPTLPPEIPKENIPKPQDDFNSAIDQTKSYYCIKNEKMFNKGITCKKFSQNIHNNCSKKYKSKNQILECVSKLLKI
jgi:hypothetical protein